MLTNSELFYRTAERFQNDRKALTDEYNAKMKGLERHRGSEYFTEESKKASKEFSEKLGALQQEARKTLYIALESMEKANNSRGVIAPTPEQINILTALKMRDKLTRAELDRAANSLSGNDVCLSVLQELAAKNDIIGVSYSSRGTDAPASVIDMQLRDMKSGIEDFLKYDTVKSGRLAAKYYADLYGTTGNEPELRKRPLFNSKDGAFSEIGGISANAAFYDAIDGTGGAE